jgi:hypothetical protein
MDSKYLESCMRDFTQSDNNWWEPPGRYLVFLFNDEKECDEGKELIMSSIKRKENQSTLIESQLDRIIKKIQHILESYRNGKPDIKKPEHFDQWIWDDIQEERYEHLENFLSSLMFIRDHPDKEMAI